MVGSELEACSPKTVWQRRFLRRQPDGISHYAARFLLFLRSRGSPATCRFFHRRFASKTRRFDRHGIKLT